MLTALYRKNFFDVKYWLLLVKAIPHLRRQVNPNLCNWKSYFHLIYCMSVCLIFGTVTKTCDIVTNIFTELQLLNEIVFVECQSSYPTK